MVKIIPYFVICYSFTDLFFFMNILCLHTVVSQAASVMDFKTFLLLKPWLMVTIHAWENWEGVSVNVIIVVGTRFFVLPLLPQSHCNWKNCVVFHGFMKQTVFSLCMRDDNWVIILLHILKVVQHAHLFSLYQYCSFCCCSLYIKVSVFSFLVKVTWVLIQTWDQHVNNNINRKILDTGITDCRRNMWCQGRSRSDNIAGILSWNLLLTYEWKWIHLSQVKHHPQWPYCNWQLQD